MDTDHFGYLPVSDRPHMQRRYTVVSRAYYAANERCIDPALRDQIDAGHYPADGGTTGDFGIVLNHLGLNLRIWDEAWHLFVYEADLFAALGKLAGKPTIADVERVLVEHGFTDATPTHRPRRVAGATRRGLGR